MKRLAGPYGWENYGPVAHATLSLRGGPRPLNDWEETQLIHALLAHSCHPPALKVILGCLAHSSYSCLMRPAVAQEVVHHGRLVRLGVEFSWHILGTQGGTEGPKTTPPGTP